MSGIENVRVKSFSKEGIDADFGVRIKNPNHLSVMVYPSTFDATINGMDIGKVQLDKRVRIPANSDDVSDFHIQSNFSKLDLISLLSLVATKRAEVTLKGNIRAGKWFYKKSFPVEFKKTISFNQ
jgi:LEA14-like dessication related protein